MNPGCIQIFSGAFVRLLISNRSRISRKIFHMHIWFQFFCVCVHVCVCVFVGQGGKAKKKGKNWAQIPVGFILSPIGRLSKKFALFWFENCLPFICLVLFCYAFWDAIIVQHYKPHEFGSSFTGIARHIKKVTFSFRFPLVSTFNFLDL